MKKNLGSVLALYPTPATVVGSLHDGRVNWLMVGSNKNIIAEKKLSVNIVDEAMLPRADYVGTVSAAAADKSGVFAWREGEAGTPVIDDSPLVMECEVVDNYETETFDNFICKIVNTYAEESVIGENGKIDYAKLKPVLFEMPTYSYLRAGDVIGKCRAISKESK